MTDEQLDVLDKANMLRTDASFALDRAALLRAARALLGICEDAIAESADAQAAADHWRQMHDKAAGQADELIAMMKTQLAVNRALRARLNEHEAGAKPEYGARPGALLQ